MYYLLHSTEDLNAGHKYSLLFKFSWTRSPYILGLVIDIPGSKGGGSNLFWTFQGHLRKKQNYFFIR